MLKQKLGRFDRLLSSRSRKKVDCENRKGPGDTVTMKTSSTQSCTARSCSSFFLFAPGEKWSKETELESPRRRKREEKDGRQRKRVRAVSISNPADCQMTRGMVLWFAVLPSFSAIFLLFPSVLNACRTLRVFKISMPHRRNIK